MHPGSLLSTNPLLSTADPPTAVYRPSTTTAPLPVIEALWVYIQAYQWRDGKMFLRGIFLVRDTESFPLNSSAIGLSEALFERSRGR